MKCIGSYLNYTDNKKTKQNKKYIFNQWQISPT